MAIGYKTMMVRVLGIGFRKTGEKYGRKYDFVPAVFAYEDKKNYEGERATEVIVEGEIFEKSPFIVGDCLEVMYHWYKTKNGEYKLSIDGII